MDLVALKRAGQGPDVLREPIVVVSPHPDDAVLSCGGLLAAHSDALVLTVFDGDPPTPRQPPFDGFVDPKARRDEDRTAIADLNCRHESLLLPDAIDRRDAEGNSLYRSYASIFAGVHPHDRAMMDRIEEALRSQYPDRLLVCPLAVGAHVDHQLAAHAGRRLQGQGREVRFYEDAPYVYGEDTVMKAALRMRGTVRGYIDLTIDRARKEAALSCYTSQIEVLFGSMDDYRAQASAHYKVLAADAEHEGQEVAALERFYLLQFR